MGSARFPARTLAARAPLEAAALAALAAAIALLAAGSLIVNSIQTGVLHLRWAGLAVACVAALALAAARPRLATPSPWAFGVAGFLGALALVSAAWSPYPRLTLERGTTFAVVLLTAGALGLHAAGRPRFLRATMAVLVGVAAVHALGGFGMLLYDADEALQRATADSPTRFQGLGQNPNTGSLLYAVVLPIAVWLAFEAESRVGRAAAGTASLALAVAIFASGSRGATIASFVAVVLVALLRGRTWTMRATLVTGVAAVYVAGSVAANMRSLEAEFDAAVEPKPRVVVPPRGGVSAGEVEEGEEIAPGIVLSTSVPVERRWRTAFPEVRGNFPYDVYAIGFERPGGVFQPAQTGIFKGSGRLQVWEGALKEAVKRPLLGFGFGLEEQVFVDRYYTFEGARPENSYIGWLLQVGAVGTGLFLGLGLVCAVLLARARVTGETAAAAGAVLAGFVVSLMQSWVYSVGNIATLTFWTALALFLAAAARPRAGATIAPPAARPEPAREEALA